MDYEKIIQACPLAMQQLRDAISQSPLLDGMKRFVDDGFVPSDDRDLEAFFDKHDIEVVLIPTFYKRQNRFTPCVSFFNDTNFILVHEGQGNWAKTRYTDISVADYAFAELTKNEANEIALEKCFELLEAKLTNRLDDYTS